MFNLKTKRFKLIGNGIGKYKKNEIKPLSNLDLIILMDKRKNKKSKFKGVFSRDELPNEIKENEALIMNLDGMNGNGTHWTCIYCDNQSCEYMDSYGLPPPENAVEIMKKTKKPIYYSTSQIQSTNSVLCGYYCVYYIMERDKGESMYDIIYKFEQITDNILQPKQNSKILIDYFNLK